MRRGWWVREREEGEDSVPKGGWVPCWNRPSLCGYKHSAHHAGGGVTGAPPCMPAGLRDEESLGVSGERTGVSEGEGRRNSVGERTVTTGMGRWQ